VLTIHLVLSPRSAGVVGERELRLMKPTAILINTARGPVIDEPVLVRALTEGWIAAAGLDVLEQEPPNPDNPLFKLDNVVITPHIAGQSDEDLDRSWHLATDSALALARGRWPRSYVNRTVKPRLNLA
jgi:phosphoglycerate dehydrogenase-like enzyme